MPNYDFYLKGNPNDVLLQLIEVTHPAFSKVYRYVKNAVDGVTVKHENGIDYWYEYSPLSIKKSKSSDDLDQSLETLSPNHRHRYQATGLNRHLTLIS